MLQDARQRAAFRRPPPTYDRPRFPRGINRLFWQTNRLDAFSERNWLSQSQQSDVMIVSVLIKVSMPNDCTDCPLNCFRFGRYKLVVIAENHANLASL